MLPRYAEHDDARPLVYLDQNVIDALRKKKLLGIIPNFRKDFRAVYSDETLKEIKRAADRGGDAKSFLKVLCDLDAYHIRQVTDENFVPQNKIMICSHSPFEIYDEFTDNLNHEYLMEAYTLINQKIMGGLSDMSLADIEMHIVNSFKRLHGDILKPLDSLEEDDVPQALIDNLRETLQSNREEQLTKFRSLIRQSVTALQKQIDSSELSILHQFRESLSLNPLRLNNITPPNVIEQIWQEVLKNEVMSNTEVTIEQFFGATEKSPCFPEHDNAPCDHVVGVYQILNMVGYHPDKKPHDSNSFVSTSSDMMHASMGYFCSAIMSCDERFVKKTSAAYEFLNIPTLIFHVKEESKKFWAESPLIS